MWQGLGREGHPQRRLAGLGVVKGSGGAAGPRGVSGSGRGAKNSPVRVEV